MQVARQLNRNNCRIGPFGYSMLWPEGVVVLLDVQETIQWSVPTLLVWTLLVL